MEEQTNAVVETPVEATPVVEETNEVSQTESEATQEEVTTEEANNSPEEQLKESDSHRPTRAERRIQQLTSKVKELSEPKPSNGDVFGNQLPPWWQTNQETEANDGEITIEQLNNKIMTVTQLAIAKDRQEQGFKQTVGTHQTELGELVDAPEFGDKNFDSKFTKLYASLNYDDSGAFRPKMSPKELFNELKGVIKLGESNGQAEAASSMAKTIANAAVTPTSNRPDTSNDESRERLQKARKTGSTDDWAAYLKDII